MELRKSNIGAPPGRTTSDSPVDFSVKKVQRLSKARSTANFLSDMKMESHYHQLLTGWWFQSLWKIWVSQLGWLFLTEWKNNPNVPKHQPKIYIYICTVPRTFRFEAEYNCTVLLSGDNNEPSTLCFLLGLPCFYIWIDYPIRPFWDSYPYQPPFLWRRGRNVRSL